MSDLPEGEPAVLAENLAVRYLIRYHRTEITLRETFVRMFENFRRRGDRSGNWREDFWALKGVNLIARPGEAIGLIGRNGSGKTTLLKSLAGILTPDRGRVSVRGKVSCLLSFGVGFNPLLSGRENIYLNGSILGLSRKTLDERYDDIVSFSELGDFIDAPVRTYSAGMKGRLGFSIAIHIDPDVLLLDEVLSVGDAAFRAKAGSILNRYRDTNKTVIVASHSMDLIRKTCDRVYWIADGQVLMEGDPDEVTDAYVRHSLLEGVKVDLSDEIAEDEEEKAKAHWRANTLIQVPFGQPGPDYARTLGRLIARTEPDSVFEFGCNAGRILRMLRRYLDPSVRLSGVDIKEEAVQHGRTQSGLELHTGDESFLEGQADGSWDIVFTVSCLVHMPVAARAVREMVRVARRYVFLYEPILQDRCGKLVGVEVSGERKEVTPFSYFHDYRAILAEHSGELARELILPAGSAGVGALYRLVVFAKPSVGAAEATALSRAVV